MLANCARFIDRRCEGGGWPSYRELEAERDRLASFLDLKVTIRDRETLARIRQADLIRVLTARGWTKRSEWVDDVTTEPPAGPLRSPATSERWASRIEMEVKSIRMERLQVGCGWNDDPYVFQVKFMRVK
jgi:hypothetical protein